MKIIYMRRFRRLALIGAIGCCAAACTSGSQVKPLAALTVDPVHGGDRPSSHVLIATAKPGVTQADIDSFMGLYGRPIEEPEPGLYTTNYDGKTRAMIVTFYANATAAQQTHAQRDLLSSGLFERIHWATR